MLKMFKSLFCCLFFLVTICRAQTNTLVVSEKPSSFSLFTPSTVANICTDEQDAKVVSIAATAFANDIQLISGKQMQVLHTVPAKGFSIVAGTIGQSKLIDDLIKSNKINVASIKHKWERFFIQTAGDKLLIVGSDRRGTAFGIFHLSRLMGVSPFVWWADVTPQKKQQLFVSGSYISNAPSVQYRGIFINDEDWGLQPWAAKNMDTDMKDIGPKTYAKVFELLLRLKANYIWPAMHPCTKAFYYYKDNPKVADDYAIVVGGSHCEPMLRNNVFEWAENYEHEYGKKPGEWRYDLNKSEIFNYWDDRVKEAVNYESVYTVGMRGVHDGSMPGPKDPNEKLKLLQTVINDQRSILTTRLNKPASEVPQIFVPYKEVLSLYRRGLELDDDVTIIWPDDNHGYIRQLPNATERERNGGHGVYYHLSYWGAPQDYLWLSSISPSLIAYEMGKAYRYGAQKLWVFNVGDIKPAEMEMQFALDMAWDIKRWNALTVNTYIGNWAFETFGKEYRNDIYVIKYLYYQLAAGGKPEHLNSIPFLIPEMHNRLRTYKELANRTQKLGARIPPHLHDAFYQLILYPVLAAKLMNEKFFYARMSIAQSDTALATQAKLAYDSIQLLTDKYNQQISNGKWNGMMSWHPREQAVFKMPETFLTIDGKKRDSLKTVYTVLKYPRISMTASLFKKKSESKSFGFSVIYGLGIKGSALTIANLKNDLSDIPSSQQPYVEYDVSISKDRLIEPGNYEIVVKCLPVFDVNQSKYLQYGISVGEDDIQTVNVHAEADSKAWRENVLKGYSAGTTTHTIKTGLEKIRIYFKNKDIVITSIEIYKANK
ncbi:glycosyl hydrolase 115 family protein [Lacibacter sp. H375]|uniref:glycosyl hydrolase 115 family protein n=1 Tax=Lacibacter sp. H375 TaxID=3133424 RepID=UPI0030BA41AE